MDILIDPGTFDCLNLGDAAMLQVAVARLQELWPAATLSVFTHDPAALSAVCPGVTAVPQSGRLMWSGQHPPFGRTHVVSSAPLSRGPAAARSRPGWRWPRLVERAVLRCPHWDGHDVANFDSAMAAMRSADLLVVSGQGTITDTGGAHATLILDTIDFVKQRGTPVAMLGQGLGPLADGALRSLCAQVLPGLTLLAMRERRTGPAIAAALGVSPDRLAVSGDDAVELAYEARSDLAGRAIGVNVRIANNAGIARDVVPVLRPVLHAAARRHDAKLVALPIARHKHSNDPASIREVTESFDEPSDGGQSLTSPLQVIRQAGRCRLVVSCAYHAAVFALAQGVPAVCLSGSRYYDDKFLGLRDMFGEGCEVIPLREGGLSERLEQVIDRFWADSDRMRPALRAAAARQVALGWATYLKLRARIQPPAGTDHGGRAA